MPDTYTKEQIDGAKDIAKQYVGKFGVGEIFSRLLSALSTAEQERGALSQRVDESSGAVDALGIWRDINAQLARAERAESERDALAARCAELEARLQGAADRGVEYVRHNLKEIWDNGTAKLRTAILGEKKE